jgi:aspartate ammonia-lyase
MNPSTSSRPPEILYGRQTELGVKNFGSGRRRLADVPTLIKNYALVKAAAAQANAATGILDAERADAIRAAAAEVADGRHDHQFPTALVLGGGGTTTNMNMNEVLATGAAQIAGVEVHPNDHVNASQSTNDTYPTAMALTVRELAGAPLEALEALSAAFDDKAAEFSDTVRLGRTCLQDAVTLTVGDTHRSHATALHRVTESLRAAVDELRSVPLGATVLGSGIGASPEYRERVVDDLSQIVGEELVASRDKFDALAHLDPYAAIASAGARAAITMAKIAADLRLLSSGPNGGFVEVTLPTVQAGSSIMPGKVNPVVPEYVMQLSYRVRGASHAVEAAVAAGELELNIMEPIIVDALIDICEDLTSAARVFADHCVKGLLWDGSRLHGSAQAGFDRWVVVAAEEGYDSATQQVRAASMHLYLE